MKNKKLVLLTLVMIAISLISFKINAKDIQHNKKITIKLNSIQCNMCVEKITEAIKSVDGVVKTKVNLNKKSASVTYNADITSKEEIENAITSAGYDANEKPADSEAYEKLSSCCKKP
ncbi:MAG: cation transporter [Bacteroidota bacterium]|nr:cation transporter [Bacteroidota bacterium]